MGGGGGGEKPYGQYVMLDIMPSPILFTYNSQLATGNTSCCLVMSYRTVPWLLTYEFYGLLPIGKRSALYRLRLSVRAHHKE